MGFKLLSLQVSLTPFDLQMPHSSRPLRIKPLKNSARICRNFQNVLSNLFSGIKTGQSLLDKTLVKMVNTSQIFGVRLISSRDNPRFKLWKRWVKDTRLAKTQSKTLVAPGRLREEFLALSLPIETEIITQNMKPRWQALSVYLSPELFRQLDALGTGAPLYVVPTPPIIHGYPDQNSWAVFLPLQDPKNLGAAIRSCHIFGIRQIVLTQESCWPYHMVVTKASALSNWQVQFYQVGSIKELTGQFSALDQKGADIQTHPGWPRWILVGQEGPGLQFIGPQTSINAYQIPTPQKQPLNATVALSIFLYELHRKKLIPSLEPGKNAF